VTSKAVASSWGAEVRSCRVCDTKVTDLESNPDLKKGYLCIRLLTSLDEEQCFHIKDSILVCTVPFMCMCMLPVCYQVSERHPLEYPPSN